jgi:hypothetical protein
MARNEPLADQLGRLGLGQEVPQMEGYWGTIIGAILKFQQEHDGRSPSNPLIAQATGLSPGQVQFHLQTMQQEGLIHDKEGWPRRLLVSMEAVREAQKRQEAETKSKSVDRQEPPAEPPAPTEEEENMATVEVPEVGHTRSGKKKRESFLVNAKRFAQVLTDYYDTHGHAPLIKDIAKQLGYHEVKPVGVSRVVKEMVQRGWLHHKSGCHADFVLTGLGRAVLFGEPIREDIHTDALVRPQPVKAQQPAPPPQHEIRRKADKPFRPAGSPHIPTPTRRREPVTGYYQPPPYRPSRHLLEEIAPVIREPEPQQVSPQWPENEPPTSINLAKVDSVDLLLELQARGFRVTR